LVFPLAIAPPSQKHKMHSDKLPPVPQSLEEARTHAAELAAVSDELKAARRQGAAQADQARRDAEGAAVVEREQLKERASELERAKEKAEATLRVTEEELKVRPQPASRRHPYELR
jgi:hypothetical protein